MNSMHKIFFLHGLDSSSKGTKGQWFAKHFPEVRLSNFQGNLPTRLLNWIPSVTTMTILFGRVQVSVVS